MQTLTRKQSKSVDLTQSEPTATEIRETLLSTARRTGSGLLHVRGVDLVAALTGELPHDWEPAT